MEILEFKKGRVYIVGVKGKLDALSAPALRDKLLALIAQGERRLVLDGSHWEYLSSAGVRVLYEVVARLQETGGGLAACALAGNVQKIFNMVDLAPDIALCASQEEACRAVDRD